MCAMLADSCERGYKYTKLLKEQFHTILDNIRDCQQAECLLQAWVWEAQSRGTSQLVSEFERVFLERGDHVVTH